MTQIAFIAEGFGHNDKIRRLCFDKQGKYCFSASWDGTVCQWLIPSRKNTDEINYINQRIKPFRIYGKHAAEVSAMALWNAQEILITGDKTGHIFAWDLKTGQCLINLASPHTRISAIFIDELSRISSSSSTLLSSSSTKLSISSFHCVKSPQIQLYSGGAEGTIYSWKLSFSFSDSSQISNTKKISKLIINKIKIFKGPKKAIHQIGVDIEQKLLISSGDEDKIYVWKLDCPANPIHILDFPEKIIFTFAMNKASSNPYLLCGGQKKKLYLIDYLNGTLIDSIPTSAPISYISFNQKMMQWLICDFKGQLSRYKVTNGENRIEMIESISILEENGMVFASIDKKWKLLALSSPDDSSHSIRFFCLY
ncbi:WD40 repeat domain-containing protein [Candidatus Harpocratesius sp.]